MHFSPSMQGFFKHSFYNKRTKFLENWMVVVIFLQYFGHSHYKTSGHFSHWYNSRKTAGCLPLMFYSKHPKWFILSGIIWEFLYKRLRHDISWIYSCARGTCYGISRGPRECEAFLARLHLRKLIISSRVSTFGIFKVFGRVHTRRFP